MIEILRKIPQNNFDLLLFLVLILISVFIVQQRWQNASSIITDHSTTKQFEISYGRHLRLTHNFIVLLSVQSILVVSHLLARYLEYCSNYLTNTHLFALSFCGYFRLFNCKMGESLWRFPFCLKTSVLFIFLAQNRLKQLIYS